MWTEFEVNGGFGGGGGSSEFDAEARVERGCEAVVTIFPFLPER